MQRLARVVRFPWSLLDNGSVKKSLKVWWRGLEQEKPVSHPLNIWREDGTEQSKRHPPKRKAFAKACFASKNFSSSVFVFGFVLITVLEDAAWGFDVWNSSNSCRIIVILS